LNRVYMPTGLLAAEGLDRTVLGKRKAPPGLLRVFDHLLDQVEGLLSVAYPLPDAIVCRGFRVEAAMIVELATRLAQRLRRQDLLARFRGLKRSDWMLAAATGMVRGCRPPQNVMAFLSVEKQKGRPWS
ncbi:MAG: squalene synthase, partial [Rhodospirillaceae bacterium]